MQHVERCLFDLRRGLPVVLRGAEHNLIVWPLEHLDATTLERMRSLSGNAGAIVLTGHRLASIGHPELHNGARLRLTGDESVASVIRCACAPAADIDTLTFDNEPLGRIEHAALYLMRRALLIPAALVAEVASTQQTAIDAQVANNTLLAVDAANVAAHRDEAPAAIRRVSEANVPLADAENARFVVFREPDGLREHIAILIGDHATWPDAVPVRLHSACLTGDLFASLRCDCGEQLRSSVAAIADHGGGVLLYLAQEGRGIGLANKMRAYHLQDGGLDTVDADQVLGFGEDERQYSVAVQMLTALDIDTIDLLTNNPNKIDAMTNNGVTVAGRHAIYGRLTRENERYLTAKARRSGHWLDSLLDSAASDS